MRNGESRVGSPGMTNCPHAVAITEIMALPEPVSCLFSVAFARSAGVASIEASIAALKIKPMVFVGIRILTSLRYKRFVNF